LKGTSGQPLGVPGDAAFQRKVLIGALRLSAAESVPVLEIFPEDAAALFCDYLSGKDFYESIKS